MPKLEDMFGASQPPSDPASAHNTAANQQPSLSPSRAADFMQCPQLYKFRSVDRLPEPANAATARGTLVHAVLEELFTCSAVDRTPQSAQALLVQLWPTLQESNDGIAALLARGDAQADAIAAAASQLLQGYFEVEDPTRVEPAHRELRVQAYLDSGLRLTGYVDRVDISPTGLVRVMDYKTGKAPAPQYQRKAMFQMLFYGLVWWRMHQVVPTRLELLYLGSRTRLSIDPSVADLMGTQRKVYAVWEAIDRAKTTGDWRAQPSKLCDWCYHKKICPAWVEEPAPAAVP